MKFPNVLDILKKITAFLPRRNIERIIFRLLVYAWFAVVIVVVILRLVHGTREDIETRIMKAATRVRASSAGKIDVEKYESLLNKAKYPEGFEKYAQAVKRDPFSRYGTGLAMQPAVPTGHDFVLDSVGRVQLPLIYRGYIELPDTIIGQINWRDTTRFVKSGSALNGYKILSVSKGRIEARNDKGERIVFALNEPVLGDELEAILYDNITEKTFTVRMATAIDDYKVIEITPDYVLLISKGEEIKLRK